MDSYFYQKTLLLGSVKQLHQPCRHVTLTKSSASLSGNGKSLHIEELGGGEEEMRRGPIYLVPEFWTVENKSLDSEKHVILKKGTFSRTYISAFLFRISYVAFIVTNIATSLQYIRAQGKKSPLDQCESTLHCHHSPIILTYQE